MCTFSQPKETVLSDLSACPELASCLSSTTSSLRQDWNCCHFITRTSSLQGTANQKPICGALWDTPSAYKLNLNQSITASRSCLGTCSTFQEKKQPFLKTKIFFLSPSNVILQLMVYSSNSKHSGVHTERNNIHRILLITSGNYFCPSTLFSFHILIKPHSSK